MGQEDSIEFDIYLAFILFFFFELGWMFCWGDERKFLIRNYSPSCIFYLTLSFEL